jgi:hypothetical protein
MIYCYNCKVEDHTSHPNNVYIGRGSVLGNPYTHDGKKSSLAKLSFKTREEAINAYKLYFQVMYENDLEFKLTIDQIYNKYKNGEDIYLQCFCKPLECHGDFIKEFLEKKLIKEKMVERKKAQSR